MYSAALPTCNYERDTLVDARDVPVFHIIVGNTFLGIVIVRVLGRETLSVARQVIDRLGESVGIEPRETMPSPHLHLHLKGIVSGVSAVFYVRTGSKARPEPSRLNIPRAGRRNIYRA